MADHEESQLISQEGWPKSLTLRKREFNALIICVQSDGILYIRDEDLQSCYVALEETLTSNFSSMVKPPENTHLEKNDMCTLTQGGKWYRGTVRGYQYGNTMSVKMIDFGSVHEVTPKDVSPYLMFADIPPFVYKVRLYDVHSDHETWCADDVAQVLKIITEHVKIVIKDDLKIDVPYAEVYLEDGTSLNHLISLKIPHMSRRVTKVDYTYDCLPKLHEKKKLLVVSVLEWRNIFEVVLSSGEDIANPEGFLSLNNELQEHAPSQPRLTNLLTYVPCVCLHPQKKIWARAFVYSVNSIEQCELVRVFFVDYGTVEVVPVADVKEVRSDWFSLPVFMQTAFIDTGLSIGEEAAEVLEQLNDYLSGYWLLVETTSQDPLNVRLYDKHGELCYQNFVATKEEDIDDEVFGAGKKKMKDYTYDCLPGLHEKKQLFVVSVQEWNTGFDVVVSSRDNIGRCEEFIILKDELQEQAPSQPNLTKLFISTPCVCLHPEKNIWARALVYVNNYVLQADFVLAFFVDYGTIEIVLLTNVKEMRSDWFRLPAFMAIVSININLLIHEEEEIEDILTKFNKHLRGKKVFVEVTSLEAPVVVHLYDEQGDLCYQDFVAAGVVEAL